MSGICQAIRREHSWIVERVRGVLNQARIERIRGIADIAETARKRVRHVEVHALRPSALRAQNERVILTDSTADRRSQVCIVRRQRQIGETERPAVRSSVELRPDIQFPAVDVYVVRIEDRGAVDLVGPAERRLP